MSETGPGKLARFVMWLKFTIADFAIRFCGVAVIYWAASEQWEAYMRNDYAELGIETDEQV